MSFSADLSRFINKTNDQSDKVVQKVVIAAYQGIQSRTPVDTGRARSNWNISTDSPDTSTTEETNSSGKLSEELGKVPRISRKDKNIYITNNLPYAMRLEYGWSVQAPSGMVRVTAYELQTKIDSGLI